MLLIFTGWKIHCFFTINRFEASIAPQYILSVIFFNNSFKRILKELALSYFYNLNIYVFCIIIMKIFIEWVKFQEQIRPNWWNLIIFYFVLKYLKHCEIFKFNCFFLAQLVLEKKLGESEQDCWLLPFSSCPRLFYKKH